MNTSISATDYRDIFNALVQDPRYVKNLDWGRPRSGHPEGTVRAHIAELEPNLEALRPRLSESEYWKLKVLIHTHDTFKGEAKGGVPILHPQSHASLARAFLASLGADSDVQAIAQYHDEPYALWRQHESKGKCDRGRFAALLDNIEDWDLFLAFLLIDGTTPGKSRTPRDWFFHEIAGRVPSRITGDELS